MFTGITLSTLLTDVAPLVTEVGPIIVVMAVLWFGRRFISLGRSMVGR